MTSSEALQSLAVHPDLISTDERRFLDENGYLPLDNILTEGEVTYLRDRLDKIAESEGAAAGSELHTEEGTVRLGNLLDKDPLFEKFITTPRVLAAIAHVIGTTIQLSSLSSRAAQPNGQGQERADAEVPDEQVDRDADSSAQQGVGELGLDVVDVVRARCHGAEHRRIGNG